MAEKLIESIRPFALAHKVLAVAVINHTENGKLFDWSVYIDCVSGMNHEQEKFAVSENGDKQNRKIAICLFPEFDINLYRL